MSALFYLLPLGLVFDLSGYLPPQLRLALVYGLLALPLLVRPSRQSAWLGAGLVLAALVKSWLPLSPLGETAWLLAMHQCVWTVTGPVPRDMRAGTVAFAVLYLVLFMSPLGHPVVEALTHAGNGAIRVVAAQGPGAFNLGPTYLGLGGILMFTTLAVFAWDGKPTTLVRAAILPPLVLLVTAVGAVILLEKGNFVDKENLTTAFAWQWEFRTPFGLRQLWAKLRDMVVVFYPLALFAGQVVVFLTVFGWRWRAADCPPAGWAALRADFVPRPWPWLLGGVAVAAVLVAAPPTIWRSAPPREIVFVEKGVVSYTKPNYEQFGEYAGGMFGMMPEYARLYGYKSTVVKEIPDQLRPEQMLVLTSLDMDLGAATRERIWQFVAAGGALWVLGDHTFIKDGRNHLNELLAPCHIRFVNDSAELIPQGWFHSYRFMQGTPYANLRDDAENRPGILVGASLELDTPAQPLVVGRFGYGDLGTDTPDPKQGHLGDFKYQRKERLGDLVLVAGETHGKGRVLVFGDTSSFFNNNLARSQELLRANLAWLCEDKVWALPASVGGRTLATLGVVGLLGLAFMRRADAPAVVVPAAVALVSLCLHGTPDQPRMDRDFARKHLALIDFSHQPNASKHTATDAGLHGVNLNLLRHGKLPITMNRWDSGLLDHARFIVFNAPRQPIDRGEQARLDAFMERGGTVIIGCGYMDAAGCRDFLTAHGLAITARPLGRFFNLPAFGKPVSFMSAWTMDRNLPSGARALCQTPDGNPLMVSVPVGKGELIVISDSEFLHNRNLEGHKNHDPQNTTFIKNLLDSLER